MCQIKVVEKIKVYILCSVTFLFFFRKSCCLWENAENVVEPDRLQMAIWRMRIACWIRKATLEQAQARACSPTNARTHTHTHTHARTQHTHVRACTHRICHTYFFSRQQWSLQRAPILRYTYIVALVTLFVTYVKYMPFDVRMRVVFVV